MRNIDYHVTCDRCGHVTVFKDFTSACTQIKMRTINGEKVDLCDNCAIEYDDWMQEVEERWLNDGKAD